MAAKVGRYVDECGERVRHICQNVESSRITPVDRITSVIDKS